ncbi:hypothetical protein C9J60_39310 [Streptomyces sp. A244]|uniref:hypothetical protein n=1 Tax=Streptomyces sp. A244 TaxID=2137016 RepID=UPI000D1BC697|nr:hypothetical protein [Streptomyces sp. A244]PTH83152.1 hypothetical protein C9J60_39310 [Streptomyces sp. A244]
MKFRVGATGTTWRSSFGATEDRSTAIELKTATMTLLAVALRGNRGWQHGIVGRQRRRPHLAVALRCD